MSDLISRQAAIDALKNRWKKTRNYEGIGDDIAEECELYLKQLPSAQPELIEREAYIRGFEQGKTQGRLDTLSAQPERRWIPCSERMPKKNGFYLCTTKDCITILEFIEGNPHYHEEPSFVSDVLGKCNSYVVAWMPLPEPYAGRRTDDPD